MSKITKQFWSLSRAQQENFIENIYKFSKDTKDIFSVWLETEKNGEIKVLERLKENIQKETSNKIGKSRKVKISNINQILKNARKYPLSNKSIIELYLTTWTHLLQFIVNVKWIPERYQKSCSKFIEEYFLELDNIPEVSARKEKIDEAFLILDTIIQENIEYKYVYLEDVIAICEKMHAKY